MITGVEAILSKDSPAQRARHIDMLSPVPEERVRFAPLRG